MQLFERLTLKAKSAPQRLVLAEGDEPRTLRAADKVIAEGIATITLIGEKDAILARAAEMQLPNIAKASFISPDDPGVRDKYAPLFYELRRKKGISQEDALRKAKDPLYLGCLMVKAGDADCMVTGALHSTGDVLRAAFQTIKTLPGIEVVSGAFLMLLPEGSPYGHDGIMVFADCAVVPDPTASELAQIAVASAKTARDIAGIPEPKVAILSFSTKGSARHERVDKVIEATEMAHALDPSLCLDGELQTDAAIVPEVQSLKAPNCTLGGRADVLVFPSLEVGNIAYKLVQRLSGAQAVGPVLQGLAAPVNDLSRGALWQDIYKTMIMTCCQAIGMKEGK